MLQVSDDNSNASAIFYDFTKNFDSVLITELSFCGVNGNPDKW